MIPLLISKKVLNDYTDNNLKLKLLRTLMSDTEKFYSKVELIEKIYDVKDFSKCSERLQKAYETNLRKLIQRTRELLKNQLYLNGRKIEWFYHEKREKGWKLFKIR